MRKIPAIILFILLLSAAGCREMPNPFEGDRVLARAGKETLRQIDVEQALPYGIAGEDSIMWVHNYVNRWVRDKLKLQEAGRLFGSDKADEELVENYRNSLLTRRLEQFYVSLASGDSLYTEQELTDYYNQHKGEFVLDRTIVRGRVIAFPTSFRQKTRVRELFRVWADEARTDLEAIAEKNGFLLRDVSEWTEYPRFLMLLPTRRNESYDEFLDRRDIQEMTDGGMTYYFVITDARRPGMTTPYEMVSGMVRWAVAARRKAEIVKSYEDSLFNSAVEKHKAVVNLTEKP